MKRIMILGGGVNQIPLIDAAKDLNYYIVLCDADQNAKGKNLADVFYNVDIGNADILVDICRNNNIDGVVCNTESLMLTLATVQSIMGFQGNTPESIEKLNDKFLFRKTQELAGVFSPITKIFKDYEQVKLFFLKVNDSWILKPRMSSGSRGVHVIHEKSDFTKSIFEDSKSVSRNNEVLVEQFVDFSNKSALEAEVFLLDGKIELMCLFRTIRDRKYNILPQCYCSDNELDADIEDSVKITLQRIFDTAGIKWGEYNVELSFNDNDEIFVIEINARQGGMMLPDFVKIYTDIDINKLLVSTAVNARDYYMEIKKKCVAWNRNCIHFRVLAEKKGKYKGYKISDSVLDYLIKEFEYSHIDDIIIPPTDGYISVALLDFDFRDRQITKEFEKKIFDSIRVIVE